MAALVDQLRQLHADLTRMVDRDPEQEVGGPALPLIDAVITEARESLPETSTLRHQVVDLISSYTVEHGDGPFRAVDLLPVVGQLLAVYQSPSMGGTISTSSSLEAAQQDAHWELLENERQLRYVANRGLFLTHTWSPSEKPGQVADVLIRLQQHRDGPLAQGKIRGVEYCLGPKFSDHTRVNTDASNGFQIEESMYGPMLCLARVTFTDASPPLILERYINFDGSSQEPGD